MRQLRRAAVAAIIALLGASAARAQTFWESPRQLAAANVTHSAIVAGHGLLAVAWQERVARAGATEGEVRLWVSTTRDGVDWSAPAPLHDPVPFSNLQPGQEPALYSLLIDGDDRIIVAVALPGEAGSAVDVRTSEDAGATFHDLQRILIPTPAVSPELSRMASGGFLLTVTQTIPGVSGAEDRLSVAYAVSGDGERWSEIRSLVSDLTLRFNLQPHHAALDRRDYLVFQSLHESGTYQLYLTWSDDGGTRWSPPAAVTTADLFRSGESRSESFNNQRPFLASLGDRLALAWERKRAGTDQQQVWYAELARDGSVLGLPRQVSVGVDALFASLHRVAGRDWLVFTQRILDRWRTVAATRQNDLWTVQQLPDAGENALFPSAASFGGRLWMTWERQGPRATALVRLAPDLAVDPPVLAAGPEAAAGTPARFDRVTVTWKGPEDPSGISAYDYRWSHDDVLVASGTFAATEARAALDASEDGSWTLLLWARDGAGNRSRVPGAITFIRDTVPPGPVAIRFSPDPDEAGSSPTNDVAASWTAPANDPAAAYLASWRQIDADPQAPLPEPVAGLPASARRQSEAGISRPNEDNGLWELTVSAVDRAGNVGEATRVYLRLSRYRPVTYVTAVEEQTQERGGLRLRITGRGFLVGGAVGSIIVDRDGRQPWDYRFGVGSFQVAGDRLISGPSLGVDVETGDYRVGVVHPVRGLAWGPDIMSYRSPGTVKLGSLAFRWLPTWVVAKPGGELRMSRQAADLLLALLVALLASLLVLASRRMVGIAREGAVLQREVVALLESRASPADEAERVKRMKELKRRGFGLRLKFSLLMTVQVLMVVAIVSVWLATQMIRRETRMLGEGLEQRAKILMDSVATRSASLIQSRIRLDQPPSAALPRAERERLVSDQRNQILDLYNTTTYFPNSKKTMGEEAVYLTVTGPGDRTRAGAPAGGESPTDRDYVWVSDEPTRWLPKYAAREFSVGFEREQDELASEVVPRLVAEVNAEGRAMLAQVQASINAVDNGLQSLGRTLTARGIDPTTNEQYISKQKQLAAKRDERLLKLQEIALKLSSSIPAFDPQQPLRSDSYLFYQPIVAQDPTAPTAIVYLGLVRLSVSTAAIRTTIAEATTSLITTTGLIALITLGLGVAGAIILSSIIIAPIRKLARGVAVIRDTEDKETLAGHVIQVDTRDEIGTLAETVNEMTQGLVEAAAENKMLLVGKDVQKMFLPLDQDAENRKGSTGGFSDSQVEIFGYYEGARGVSGDYFDFQKIDDHRFLLVKCDVAGKGVPAALIMVEVATLCLNAAREWARAGAKGQPRVDSLLYTINDMVEERGFKGRFAALILCLYDSRTGMATYCHAGDKVYHVFDADAGRMITREMAEAPAAGVFPSTLVEMKSGFPTVVQRFDHGDAMVFFSDGFDESNRANRAADGTETGLEALGVPRIYAVLEAAFGRRTYRLSRADAPSWPDMDFDFSTCDGSVQDAVMALVSVERAFRIYRTAAAGPETRVSIDAKVDAFLQKHFQQYGEVFDHRVDGAGGAAVFSHLLEDEQDDDLTLLVVRRR